MEGTKKLIINTKKNAKFSFKKLNIENAYIIKIINKTNNIKFEILKIDDENKEYSLEYNIDDFHINLQ